MRSAMSGLYIADKDGRETGYKSEEQIRYANLDSGEVVFRDPDKYAPLDFNRITDEMIRRREFEAEAEPNPRTVEVDIKTDKPIAFALFGDLHLGSAGVSYELVQKVANLIAEHPLLYAHGMADMIDGKHFANQDEIADFDTQTMYAMSLVRFLQGKWLGFKTGEHDYSWAKKYGPTLYRQILDTIGAPVTKGPSIFKLNVGPDSERAQHYNFVVAHRASGFSQYNKNHSQKKMAMGFSGPQGADGYFVAHEHQKAIQEDVIETVDGPKSIWYAVTGPFQYSSDYAQKIGYMQQGQDEDVLGPVWVMVRPDKKKVQLFKKSSDVVEALAPYLD